MVPINDVHALTSAMAEMADHCGLAERLACEAIKVRESYRAEVIGEKWLQVIHETIEEFEHIHSLNHWKERIKHGD